MGADDATKKLLDKLCPQEVNPWESQERYRSTLSQNTGLWIFQNERYKSWLTTPGSFLWLQGKSKSFVSFANSVVIVGAGKTILT
jgi:hypothetical protein